MAKPLAAWANIKPTQGAGDTSLSVGAQVYYGRTMRSTEVFAEGADGLEDDAIFNQTGHPEFIEAWDAAVGKDGGTVTISGETNTQKITIKLQEGNLPITLPPEFSAAGMDFELHPTGNEIDGDPGAVAKYAFWLTFEVPKNETVTERIRTVNFTAKGGQTSNATIRQAAGDPYLHFVQKEVTTDWTGIPVNLDLETNSNFTIKTL